ncbi:aromatic-ring-hydroxylating dioxygenase subunit beta [Gordonia aquimaris]|uniref:3-phenylpropionate/cinnamic acid dioxygenase subunit beta n=1 Tax=Gordonia aquimaris TaxID=2984863 RepID=A0A9X3I345_9ACTN|nr:3-phenylpropionate/cinnamic acid dioxygenase subunit beta [Gordonia aquimaris]MCX2962786.1 3-phenylpropionate/cinnamic acid dioxygenase subunit beta [Gordonia aquimaris]
MLTTGEQTTKKRSAPMFRSLGMTSVSLEEQHAVEQFLFAEAELIDEWQWRTWFDLFTDDAHYRMPIRRNRLRRQRKIDEADDLNGLEVAHFDDDKASLEMRIEQLESGMHWAEDPPSRSRHLVTNVRVQPADVDGEYFVRSNFFVYRNRLEAEVDLWAGERRDVLRLVDGSFRIADRIILLDQNLILAKNLSVFF